MGSRKHAAQQAALARMAGVPLSQLGPQAAGASVPAEGPAGAAPKSKSGWKRHTRLGRGLEARLEAQHGFYEHNRLACVEKQHAPLKWIGGKPTVVGRAIVDYLGVIAGDGRAVAIEAKNPSRGLIDLLDPDEVEPHQVAFLRRWPGLGFYLLCFGEGHTADAVLVPAARVVAAIDRAWKDQTTARWRESDALAAGGVKLRGVDWLGGVVLLGI